MSATAKPYKGLAMEGVIASWYASNTKGFGEIADLAQRTAR